MPGTGGARQQAGPIRALYCIEKPQGAQDVRYGLVEAAALPLPAMLPLPAILPLPAMLPLSSHSPEETLSVGAGETPGWEVGLALELGEPEPPQQPPRRRLLRHSAVKSVPVVNLILTQNLIEQLRNLKPAEPALFKHR